VGVHSVGLRFILARSRRAALASLLQLERALTRRPRLARCSSTLTAVTFIELAELLLIRRVSQPASVAARERRRRISGHC